MVGTPVRQSSYARALCIEAMQPVAATLHSSSMSVPTGAEIFAVFDALDDVRKAIYDKYLAIAKAEVAAYAVFDIDAALDEIWVNVDSYRMTHEEKFGGSEDRANEAAASMCAIFESVEPTE